jgi:hypothetical protein
MIPVFAAKKMDSLRKISSRMRDKMLYKAIYRS